MYRFAIKEETEFDGKPYKATLTLHKTYSETRKAFVENMISFLNAEWNLPPFEANETNSQERNSPEHIINEDVKDLNFEFSDGSKRKVITAYKIDYSTNSFDFTSKM